MNIDLGKESGAGVPISVTSEPEKKCYYPSLYVGDVAEDLGALPEEGEMTVRYKRTASSSNTRGDETTYSAHFDILAITEVEASDDSEDGADDKSRENSLDSIAAEEAGKPADEYDEQ